MQKPIVIFSEGRVYEGKRTPQAWSWHLVGVAPEVVPTPRNTKAEILAVLVKLGVPKDERRQLGDQLNKLSAVEHRKLLVELQRRLRR